MALQVYTADDEEFVIAESPEDAAVVYAEAEAAQLVVYDDWKPTAWEAMPGDQTFHYRDDHIGDVVKTCAEWAAERGRGYFASANV